MLPNYTNQTYISTFNRPINNNIEMVSFSILDGVEFSGSGSCTYICVHHS